MADSDTKHKIITDDFNSKNRTKSREEDFKNIGAFKTGDRMKEEIA